METTEQITTDTGVLLRVLKKTSDDSVTVDILVQDSRKCILHWGVKKRGNSSWQSPPERFWPEGTRSYDDAAARTPFVSKDGAGHVEMHVGLPSGLSSVEFALYFPEEDRWDNNRGRNYSIELPEAGRTSISPRDALAKDIENEDVLQRRIYDLGDGLSLAVALTKHNERYLVHLLCDIEGTLLLHWGVGQHSRFEWNLPPESLRPPESEVFDDKAVRTPFAPEGGLMRLSLELPKENAPFAVPFVLYQPGTGRWFKDGGKNFSVAVAVPSDYKDALGTPLLSELADEIIQHEMSRNSWTLMHRFNLCYDLLDRIKNDVDGLALIFVWLRFSALRQLDWQRNYNTKPRELGHALDRLTLKLAGGFKAEPADRGIIRLILTTLGRGSDAQRVRDEVLHIMHRHHIKEVSGHFMEEWHQKLHNNATPDDIVICEAFLEFQRSDGNLELFYKRLEEGGVTRKRLESYERPITSHPDFIPHLKDALIRDFEHFLGILREVHSGTDLGTSIKAARYLFDEEMHRIADFLWEHRDDRRTPPSELVGKIVFFRRRLSGMLDGPDGSSRDLLFLDLALENFSRNIVERNLDADLGRDQLVELVGLMVESVHLSTADDEFGPCLTHWKRLASGERFGKDWSLHADSVLDRLHRSLGTLTDRCYTLLQPKAEFLGRAFGAESWTIRLFSEEVVRGRPAFALSMLLQKLNPILRRTAELGDWQIISPGSAGGFVEVVDALKSVQGRLFGRQTIIVAGEVGGDEEIPDDVTAVVTSRSTDVLSHVAIRARNAGVLFAVSYNEEDLRSLKSLGGSFAAMKINAAGELLFEKGSDAEKEERPRRSATPVRSPRPSFTSYAVASDGFTVDAVGGKSNNIRKMQGRLPEWVHLPASAALPFGVFEKVLSDSGNKEVAALCEELAAKLRGVGPEADEEILSRLRETILRLRAPAELTSAVRRAMHEAGLAEPKDWEGAWTCIKKVWASKWNLRAFLSRRSHGIAEEDLFMAVLIQEVVRADYSYVVHTVNPFTGARDEIYAEAVLGLGEALVGNYPGRAMSFTRKKGKQEPKLLSYPGKSIGLFGGGLIFRSDSNREDLAEYAGAGLYDSFMLPQARRLTLDYTDERIVWDRNFQRRFMSGVSEIGELVEGLFGSPQDIEGAFSGDKFYVVQARPQVGIKNV